VVSFLNCPECPGLYGQLAEDRRGQHEVQHENRIHNKKGAVKIANYFSFTEV
jgi:hypothetical protein